jgi:transposase-like protein
VIRYGRESGKQVYKCKVCDRKFVPDNEFKKLKYEPKIITATLDLYFKGVSLRKISDHLKQFYGLNVNFTTLYHWIKHYTKIMSGYVKQLVPEISGTLCVDEMQVKVGGEWKWLWNIMDKETRFLLASQISDKREIEDARRLFQKAKERIKGQKVEKVVSDGLRSYQNAFKKEFFTLHKPRTEHIRHIRLAGEVNNNLIERFQGTRRERDKVLRGMKDEHTPIIEGFDIYYNFIRSHMSLNGKTPTNVANINVSLEQNRWLSLLKESLASHRKYKIKSGELHKAKT